MYTHKTYKHNTYTYTYTQNTYKHLRKQVNIYTNTSTQIYANKH